MPWYVAHTHAGAESRAVWHLERQGFTTFLPQYLKRRRHARRTDWVRAPLFPRYLFISLDVARERWQAIQSTIGVRYLICADGKPLELHRRVVEELREREDEHGLIAMSQQCPFQHGDRVQVTEGALIDQIGIFQCSSDKERAVVLLKLLGRDLRVEVAQAAIGKAA